MIIPLSRSCGVLLGILGMLTLTNVSFSEGETEAPASAFSYNDHDKRDPFLKLLGPGGTVINYDKDVLITDMILEGVVIETSGDSIAIINGNIVKINEKIGMFIIKEIQPNAVILQKGQESFTLKLKKEE